MLRTRVTELFGIEHPVLLGGMGSATNVDLVVAVSEAGGLGILGATHYRPDEVRAQIEAIRARTARPFGVNFLIAFSTPEQIEAALEARVPVLSTAWGDPATYTRRARAAGIPVVHMVQTAAQAAAAVQAGASAIVAQGSEGGGHVGAVASMPLVPAVIDAVALASPPGGPPPPVIAAGGIADGRGLAAALAMGAHGVLMGTRFLATPEAPVPEFAKQAVCAASEADTIRSPIPDLVQRPAWLELGAQSRALRTRALEAWVGREQELAGLSQDERRRLAEAWAQARAEGRADDTIILAGQDCGLIRASFPAASIVRRIVAEAEALLRRAASQIE